MLLWRTEDHDEGIAAFIEKRLPRYKVAPLYRPVIGRLEHLPALRGHLMGQSGSFGQWGGPGAALGAMWVVVD